MSRHASLDDDTLWTIDAQFGPDVLRAVEPSDDEITAAAPVLASYYNEPENRRMMANEWDFVPDDVIAFYRSLRAAGGRPFLLWRRDELMGDADLRAVPTGGGRDHDSVHGSRHDHHDGGSGLVEGRGDDDGGAGDSGGGNGDSDAGRDDEDGRGGGDHTQSAAELAILIGPRASHGRGLGTRFAIMLHAFAFQILALDRIYVSVVPDNQPSLRLFQKLGYARDDSARARHCADDPADVTFSVGRRRFEIAALAHGVEPGAIRCLARPR